MEYKSGILYDTQLIRFTASRSFVKPVRCLPFQGYSMFTKPLGKYRIQGMVYSVALSNVDSIYLSRSLVEPVSCPLPEYSRWQNPLTTNCPSGRQILSAVRHSAISIRFLRPDCLLNLLAALSQKNTRDTRGDRTFWQQTALLEDKSCPLYGTQQYRFITSRSSHRKTRVRFSESLQVFRQQTTN